MLSNLSNIQKRMSKWLNEKIKKHKKIIVVSLISVGVTALVGGILSYILKQKKEVNLSDFFEALRGLSVKDVKISGKYVYFRQLMSDWHWTSIGEYPLPNLIQEISHVPNISYSCQPQSSISSNVLKLSVTLASLAVLYHYLPSQFKIKDIFKQHNTNYAASKPLMFQDYYGGKNVKDDFKYIIQCIKQPEKYKNFKLKQRKYILLHGPFGSGKKTLAKIFANQAKLQFISIFGSQFEECFRGISTKRIQQIVTKAKNCPNGCVIFINNLETLYPQSQQNEKQQKFAITQLLNQLDELIQNYKIYVIGSTTNLKQVNKQLLKPNRFNFKCAVKSLQSVEERQGFILKLIRNKNIQAQIKDDQINDIANKTAGWNGYQLQNLINQSGYQALKTDKKITTNIIKSKIQFLREK